MATVDVRNLRYFRSVYRLAQQAAEAVAFFGVIRRWFNAEWIKDFNNAVVNEDLLRIIASTSKRTAIVTIHILCDNRKAGSCNVFRLVERIGLCRTEKRTIRQRLKSIAPTLRKVSTLRNHIDAHLVEDDEWRKGFGDGLKKADVDHLLTVIFSVLIDCGKVLGISKLRYDAVRKVSELYADRLVRALREQVSAGKTGRQLLSVRDWEEERESQDEFEPD